MHPVMLSNRKRAELKEGVRGGLFAAKWFSVLAGMLSAARILRGGADPYAEFVEYLSVVCVYVIGGVAGGSIVAVLQDWATSMWRTAVVGMIATVPVTLAARVTLWGFGDWTTADAIVLPAFAVLWGGIMGIIYWRT